MPWEVPAEENAGTFSTAADNTHELTRQLLLTERDRKTALLQMEPQPTLERAWDELRVLVVPRPDVEEG